SRDRPQTPWPDVQPDPKLAPRPTITPPMAIILGLTGTSSAGQAPVTMKISPGASTMPSTNAARQANSDRLSAKTEPETMPVAPKIRPRPSIRSTAASPIRRPPPNEAEGVKAVSISALLAGLDPDQRIKRAHPDGGGRQHHDPNYDGAVFEQRRGKGRHAAEEREIEQDDTQRGAQDTVDVSHIGGHGVLQMQELKVT